MSGPKLIFAIFLIIILSVGGLLGFYFYLNKSTPLEQPPLIETKPTFTGFDQVSLDNSTKTSTSSFDFNSYNASTSPATSTVASPVKEELLRLISAQPVAGHDFIVRDVDTSTLVATSGTSTKPKAPKKIISLEFIRFILKANGNIFETGTSSTSTINRVTNKTIPKLHEAFFNTKGDGVLIRNIVNSDNIQTRYLSLRQDPTSSTSTLQEVVSTALPLDITQVSLSPDKKKFFYTKDTGNLGTIANLDGGAKSVLFESPFKEWLPQWASAGTIFLNTKPSNFATGYLYSLDVRTSTITKVLGDVKGLTSLVSKDGQGVLYTKTDNGILEMSYYTLKDKDDRRLVAETLPEKCVWGNKYTKIIYCAVPKNVPRLGTYPDDWYLGLLHFNDYIWRMNLETGENKIIVDPEKQISLPLDIVNLKLSKNDDYLIFEDKKTFSLWGIGLESPISTATSTR